MARAGATGSAVAIATAPTSTTGGLHGRINDLASDRGTPRLLGGGHDTTNPLLAAAAPLAAELLPE